MCGVLFFFNFLEVQSLFYIQRMNHEVYLYHVNPLGCCPAGYGESLKVFKQGSCKILILFFKDDLRGI